MCITKASSVSRKHHKCGERSWNSPAVKGLTKRAGTWSALKPMLVAVGTMGMCGTAVIHFGLPKVVFKRNF